MKLWKNVVIVVAAVGATTLITDRVVSQDYEKKLDKKTGELRKQVEKEAHHLGGQPSHDEQMEAWLKYGKPGPEHARMAKRVGTWEQECRHFEYPGAEPTVSAATAKVKSVMDGRYFTEKMAGKLTYMGEEQDFEGFGLFGYDNLKKKYFFAWIDSMSTMMMVGEGEEDTTGAIVYHSEMPNPMDGSTMKVKSISRELSDDKYTLEMHMQMPDGTWFKSMDITGMRKG
jgi:hypothetical protein